MDFEGFIRDIKENEWKVFGTEVYENGHLKHAWGDTCENTHYIYSATKTILSPSAVPAPYPARCFAAALPCKEYPACRAGRAIPDTPRPSFPPRGFLQQG